MAARALSPCSGGGGAALTDLSAVEVTVQDADGTRTYSERTRISGSGVGVGGVPEGTDQTVTLTGLVGEDAAYFGRAYDVLVEKGRENPVQMALSKFGGFSCPKPDAEYTHRIFPTATPIGGGYFLVAGGFTSSSTSGATTYTAGDSGKKAFLYDSGTGVITRVSNTMSASRGGHAAIYVRGTEKSQVVLFGGASKLTFDPASTNGFGWRFDAADALNSIDVFEWETGTKPTVSGKFLEGNGQNAMLAARVFPTAASVSSDGLVMVCDGGPWGGAEVDGNRECDVFDASIGAFLPSSKNFPRQYRAGGAVASYGTGEMAKLIFVGGGKQQPVELYRGSTAQRAGSGGTFSYADNGYDDTPLAFFPSLTPLGNNRFAMIGGVRWNGSQFEAPSASNSVLLTIQEDKTATYVIDDPLPGLNVGRYFHSAAAGAGDRLAVVGGFTSGTSLEPTDSVRLIDIVRSGGSNSYTGFTEPKPGELFGVARGGMAATLLDNDTILIAGGIGAVDDLSAEAPGALEVYTPSHLLPIVLPEQ